jgi:small subunit ribosomal protein S1
MALASKRIRQYELDPDELEKRVATSMTGVTLEELSETLAASVKDIRPGAIVEAIVDSVDERTGQVVMDIGGKAEGNIPLSEFGETLPVKGQVFEVFFEGLDESDLSLISKRRADRLRAWERVSVKYSEGDVIQGICQRKIKGGLLVDVE